MIPFDKREGKIWYNNELIEWQNVKLHVLSHGLHYASCIFEGLRVYEGEIFKLEEHTERFFYSAKRMGFKIPYSEDEINSASRKIIGATEIPSDVDDLSVSMVGSNQMELSWTPVDDLDISWYEIRFQDVTSGATWNESTPIAKVVRRKSNSLVVNAQVGSYCIKAVDKLGNSSAEASIISTNISGLQNFTNVLTLSE